MRYIKFLNYLYTNFSKVYYIFIQRSPVRRILVIDMRVPYMNLTKGYRGTNTQIKRSRFRVGITGNRERRVPPRRNVKNKPPSAWFIYLRF